MSLIKQHWKTILAFLGIFTANLAEIQGTPHTLDQWVVTIATTLIGSAAVYAKTNTTTSPVVAAAQSVKLVPKN